MSRFAIPASVVAAALMLFADATQASGRAQEIAVVSATFSSRMSSPIPGNKAYVATTEEDLLYADRPMFGRRRGAQVGTDVAVLTRHGKRQWITLTTHLPNGDIRARGEMKMLISGGVVGVVGGTGAYLNARGTLIIRNLRAPGLARNIYRLG